MHLFRNHPKRWLVATAGVVVAAAIVVVGVKIAQAPHQPQLADTMIITRRPAAPDAVGWQLTIKPNGGGTLAYTGGLTGQGAGAKPQSFAAGHFATTRLAAALQHIKGVDQLRPADGKVVGPAGGLTVLYQGETSGNLDGDFSTAPQPVRDARAAIMQLSRQATGS